MDEQLEEGEIIDDDNDDGDDEIYNFEDISDNSIIDIIPNTNGKFVTSNERLRALSLSSVSDTDISTHDNYNDNSRKDKKRSKHVCKRHHHRHHHHHHHNHEKLFETDSSDTDIYYQDDNLKDKLKEAIRISDDDDNNVVKRSNLQTRLKLNAAGCESDPTIQEKHEINDDLENLRLEALKATEFNRDDDKQDTDKSNRIDDSELENLRLEALRTAVLNKFQKRKRRKALQENQQNDNKENTDKIVDNDENTIKTINNGDNQQNNQMIDLEEDEDLLRASLLANLAKKIKTTSEELEIAVVPEKPLNLPQKIINNNHKSIPNKGITKIPDPSKFVVNNLTKKELPRKTLPVKPLIINLKDDSDSDEDYENLQQNPTTHNTATKKPLDDLVEKFLKEQRAKVETQQLLKSQLQKPQFQQIKKTKIVRNNSNIMEKSAMKLLPKSAQLEYQELLKRLKTAEIKQKILKRRNCVEKVEMNHKKEEPTTNGKDLEVHQHLTTFQKTLKEIRIQKNGSLQMKNKYQDLTPIMRKINEARIERKKYENLIKTLLNDLKEARCNLWRSHEKFSLHVKELIERKTVIDKSLNNNINKQTVKINNNQINNTVNNGVIVEETQIVEKQSSIITSTPIKSTTINEAITPIIFNDKNDICEDMEICTNDDEQEQNQLEQQSFHIDIVDPNDIDKIYKKRPIKSYVPEYISPLTNYERYNNVDPYGIMCPYEVNGACRDTECSFKHFLKIEDNTAR